MYLPQLTTLAYIVSGTQVLLCHRMRAGDQQRGKYNGVGGKMEPFEDPVACVTREIKEETDLIPETMRLRGTVSWPGFGPDGEHVFGFVFLITAFSGTPRTQNEEGALEWHPIAGLSKLEMWDGDRHFLPLVFDSDPRQFHVVLPYEGGHHTSVVSVTRL